MFRSLPPVAFAALALASPLFAGNAEPGYVRTNLVANKASYEPKIVDPMMLDAWGLAIRPPGVGGHIWISNTHSGTSSEFIGDLPGNPLHRDNLKIVTLDMPEFADAGYAFVTGQAYNAASDIPGQPVEFPISGDATNLKANPPAPIPGGYSGPAKFAFVTMDGCINAWSSGTALAMDDAPIVVDYSKCAKKLPRAANCVFTGTAFTANAHTSPAFAKLGGNRLFATDFRHGEIRVFDAAWRDITDAHPFPTPPSAKDLHPFNVADIGGRVFVTYAKFDAASDEGWEQMLGGGLGHVAEFTEDGVFVRDFADEHLLNAPWGVAIAPATFAEHAGDILVGSFGDGTIAAFDAKDGRFKGYLRDPDTKIISIDGLWALAFGNGTGLGDANSLYFTAGPENEQDGVFGRLDPREAKK